MAHPIAARNIIDRAIEAVSPTWASRRYAGRAQIEMARSMPASTFGARNRFSQSFAESKTIRGGRTIDRLAQASARDRGRHAYAGNVIARSLLVTETDYVVADGFTLQMGTKTPGFNVEAQARFWEFMDAADITGQRTGVEMFRASWLEPRKDGDGAILKLIVDGKCKLQYIPGDLIARPFGGGMSRSNYDGVQCDTTGRPTQFDIRSADEFGSLSSVTVDAADIIFLSHVVDPLAIRGTSVFATVFEQLDQLDSYVDSVTKTAIMACIFGLIEKRKNPTSALANLGMQPNSNGTMEKAVSLEGGMLKVMGTDDSVIQVNAQQPMTQTPDFIRALFRIICLAFEMPIEIGQKDLSQVNFSGGRIGLLGFYRSCRIKQEWLQSRCWRKIVLWWLETESQRQLLGYPDAFKTPFPEDFREFELRGREYEANDRVSEAQADQLEIDTGTSSLQQIIARKGGDYEGTQKQRIEHYAACREQKIPIVMSSLTRDGPESSPAPIVPAIPAVVPPQ